jgi:integrase
MARKKTNPKFWEARVFRYNPGDKDALFYVRLQYAGRRDTFCCHATTRAQAASIAKRIYMELRTLGWEATLKKRKPEAEPKSVATVGEFLDRISIQFTGQQRTIKDYCQNFRRVVADIFEVSRDRKKYDYVNGGRLEWLGKVNVIRLVDITPEKIQAWRIDYLDRAGDDLDKRRSAQASLNTVLRQARSLFSSKRLELIQADPPIQSPFRKIKLESEGDTRYRSTVDVAELVQAALAELADEPQMLKVFILAICAGLRRNEIDKLEWSAFDWSNSSVHIGPTKVLHVKSLKSIGDVDLDPETVALFRGYYARRSSRERQSDFVIESDIAARPRAGYPHYRCSKVFAKLAQWLRTHGIKSKTPIHTLRKEFGSLITQQFGIHAASAALRHAGIAITSRHYVGKKARTVVGLGPLLGASIISMQCSSSHPAEPEASAVVR